MPTMGIYIQKTEDTKKTGNCRSAFAGVFCFLAIIPLRNSTKYVLQ